jgi:hypothetical protein
VNRRYALAILISPMFVMSKKRTLYLTAGFLDDEGRQQAAVFEMIRGASGRRSPDSRCAPGARSSSTPIAHSGMKPA